MTWKTIPNTDGIYQITKCGQIRISPRTKHNPYTRLKPGDLIKTHLGVQGYYMTNLKRPKGYVLTAVHRLLMQAYRPTKRTGVLQINHIDGDKSNNSLSNLEWCTQHENLKHAWEHRLRKQPKHDTLTPEQVIEIRRNYVKGQSPTLHEIGNSYGVTASAIWRIVNNKNWKHLL